MSPVKGEFTLRAIAKHMLDPTPSTRGLSKLEDIARHIDETDAELGIAGDEMQRDLRAWADGLREALGGEA